MLLVRTSRSLGARNALPRATEQYRRAFRVTGALNDTLDAPFISDTVPLAEGILGTVEELHCEIGDQVQEMDVIAIVETDKVSLDIKANRSGTVSGILVELGEQIKERQPLYSLKEGTATKPL